MVTEPLQSLAAHQSVLAWIFIICGVLAIAFALFFLLIIKYSFFKGLAWIFLPAGILQIIHGTRILSDYRMRELSNFTCFSLIILLSGIVLLFIFRRSAQRFWKGIGLGMTIQGALWAGLSEAEKQEFKHYLPGATQQAAYQAKYLKKNDEGRNSYADYM